MIVATRGRARETYALLDCLDRQSRRPDRIFVVGAGPEDVAGLESHPGVEAGRASVCLSPIAGLCAQRNHGVRQIGAGEGHFMAAFFDDDFRPDDNWLERAEDTFSLNSGVAGLTGLVLADGILRGGLAEEDARDYLAGRKPPEKHWASGARPRDVDSVYGCNMAFRDTVLRGCRFDEELALYGWQEDRDFTGQARRFGRVILEPECRGVHLGVSSGRTSGLRLGYSQIANLVYMARKGTTDWTTALRFMSRNVAANIIKPFLGRREVDYPGRLRGNLLALQHLLFGRCRPSAILDI